MKATADQIRADQNFELVTDEELPVPEVYRDKRTGNHVFCIGAKVFDQFCILRDIAGELKYDYRRSGLFRKIKNAAEAAAGILIFASNPATGAVLRALGIRTNILTEVFDKVDDIVNKESVQVLIEQLGPEALGTIHTALKAALKDGVFTVDDWKAIQALARQAM